MPTLCVLNDLDFKQRATQAYAQLFMVVAQLGLGDDISNETRRILGKGHNALVQESHPYNHGPEFGMIRLQKAPVEQGRRRYAVSFPRLRLWEQVLTLV